MSVPDDIENGIQVIVFGTFLMEASCNDSYREFLSTVITNGELADAIWNATNRLSILEKVNVAAAVNPVSKADVDDQVKRLKLLLDLRNRLAHFKDSDTVWDAPVEFVSKPENWFQAPEPELMGHLTGQKLPDYVSDIDRLLAWLDRVLESRERRSKRLGVNEAATARRSFYCLILGFATEYSKSVRKFTAM